MAAVILAATAYHLSVLRSHFDGYVFGFHDLGIITDWFTNALREGRPFWITDMAVNHLSVHFTPTLLLWTPFYLLSDSAFVLLVLGALTVAAALYAGHRLFLGLAASSGVPRAAAVAASTFLAAFVSLNPYVRTVLGSAHIEVLYVPLALALFHRLLTGGGRVGIAVLFVLALGVREEAGLYLAAQCLALALLPRGAWAEGRRPRALLACLAAASLVWVVLVVKVVNPLLFGAVENHVQRGWGSWGTTWTGVVLAMLSSPRRLLEEVGRSAFLPLNGSFLFLPWFSVLFGALVNAPGVLLFAADRPDARFLWYYHASFLLPGLMLGAYAGASRLLRAAAVAARRRPAAAPALAVGLAVAGLAVLGVAVAGREWTPEAPRGYSHRRQEQALRDAAFLRSWLAARPEVQSAATDFRRVVYLPNRVERFLLRNADRADVVFLFPGADPMMSGAGSAEEVRARLDADRGLVLEGESAGVRVYVRRRAGAATPPP